jgi:polyhydroxyalkanoate synthesis regulator phasin
MREEIRRLVTVSSGMAELTLSKAEGVARDLAERAGLSPEQVSSLGHEIVERSRENRREITALIRAEIRSQLTGLGVANRHEIERLERRVARLEERLRPPAPGEEPVTPARARKRTAAKRSAARKPGGRAKSTAGKSTARKSTARKPVPRRPAAGDGS